MKVNNLKSIRDFGILTFCLACGLLFSDVFYNGTKLGLRDHPKKINDVIDDVPSILLFSIIAGIILYFWDSITKWDKLDKESAEKLH